MHVLPDLSKGSFILDVQLKKSKFSVAAPNQKLQPSALLNCFQVLLDKVQGLQLMLDSSADVRVQTTSSVETNRKAISGYREYGDDVGTGPRR